jgi:uncharacterized protein
VRRAGRYAIDLYSGQLEIADAAISTMTAAKPLRIMVLGQAKAGKSSLINAIFGAVRVLVQRDLEESSDRVSDLG